MFKYKDIAVQLQEAKAHTKALNAELLKAYALIDYLSMMTDVEIDTQSYEEEMNHGA